jgi:hypothetical protein
MKPLLLRLIGAGTGAVLAALVWAAGMETCLRLTVPASSNDTIYRYTLDSKRYKVMKASASMTAWGKELRTNDLGFRDNAPTIPPKQPGEFRIVVLGNSVTVAAGVGFDDIYSSRLEQLLQRTHPNAQVINLAVGGYNPVQQALVLHEVGLALEPDLVLVGLFPSDDFSLDLYEQNRRVAMGEAPAKAPEAWYEGWYVYRAHGRKIVDKVAGLLRRGAAQSDGSKARRGWDESTAALKAIAATARERGLAFAMAVLPHTHGFSKQHELFGRVERFCHEADMHCINLLEPFVARRTREADLRLNPLDGHPNEKYHAVVAEVLAGALAPMMPPTGLQRSARHF